MKLRYAVLGAGCGGQTYAGHLASMGYDVSLYNRSDARLGNLAEKKIISLENALNTSGKVKMATTDIGEAVTGTDIIMVVTTALGHGYIGKELAPHLNDGQIIVLNPGRTFGSLEVSNEIYSRRPGLDVTICEANTLIYATRVTSPGVANVYGLKDEVVVAALRPSKTLPAVEKLQQAYPQIRAGKNILETSLGNIGAVFHPTIMLLNKDRIARGESFEFYREGVDQKVAEYMRGVDQERRSIALKLDTEIPSIEEWLSKRYNIDAQDLEKLLKDNPAYAKIPAPKTFHHRYILEDVPTGLVPLAHLGESLGVETPHIDHLIQAASDLIGEDFSRTGRSLAKLGLEREDIKTKLYEFLTHEKLLETVI